MHPVLACLAALDAAQYVRFLHTNLMPAPVVEAVSHRLRMPVELHFVPVGDDAGHTTHYEPRRTLPSVARSTNPDEVPEACASPTEIRCPRSVLMRCVHAAAHPAHFLSNNPRGLQPYGCPVRDGDRVQMPPLCAGWGLRAVHLVTMSSRNVMLKLANAESVTRGRHVPVRGRTAPSALPYADAATFRTCVRRWASCGRKYAPVACGGPHRGHPSVSWLCHRALQETEASRKHIALGLYDTWQRARGFGM